MGAVASRTSTCVLLRTPCSRRAPPVGTALPQTLAWTPDAFHLESLLWESVPGVLGTLETHILEHDIFMVFIYRIYLLPDIHGYICFFLKDLLIGLLWAWP